MTVAANYLRRDVLIGSDEGIGTLAGGKTRFPAGNRVDPSGSCFLALFRRRDQTRKAPTFSTIGAKFRVGLKKFGSGGLLEAPRKVEVGECNVTGLLDQNVLWFQVSVSDPHGVEMLKRTDDLSHVESNNGRAENAVVLTAKEDVEIAAGAIRDSPYEKFRRLVGS